MSKVIEMEIKRIAIELARDEMRIWLANADDKKLSRCKSMVKMYQKKIHKGLLDTVANTQKGEELRMRTVTVYGCRILHDVNGYIHEERMRKGQKLRLKLNEFESMVESGTLRSNGNFGRVYGYADMTEIALDDFTEDRIEFDCGNGIVEVVTKDRYLESRSGGMGNSEILRIIADNEIPYGTYREIDTGHDDYAGAHIIELEKEQYDIGSYDYRDETETKYYFDKVNSQLDKEFKSHKEIYNAVVGTIFPVNNWRSTHGVIHKQVWMLPYNSISKQQRKQLRDKYQEMIRPFVEAKVEAEMIIASLKEAKDIGEILADVSTDLARAILGVASRMKRETNKDHLSKRAWIAVHKIANPVVVTPEARKRLGEITSLITIDATLREEAIKKIVGDHAKDILDAARIAKQRPLKYQDYMVVRNLSRR